MNCLTVMHSFSLAALTPTGEGKRWVFVPAAIRNPAEAGLGGQCTFCLRRLSFSRKTNTGKPEAQQYKGGRLGEFFLE